MSTLEELLVNELEWRTRELSILKSIPYLYRVTKVQREVLLKYSIPAMYALWEGFVKASFEHYVRSLNALELPNSSYHENLVTHDIDTKFQLGNSRVDYAKKVKLVTELKAYFQYTSNLSMNIPTESNVSFKVINKILKGFNLEPLPTDPFEIRLNKLLIVRNAVAHGEQSIPVTQELCSELSITAVELMYELFERIVTGFNIQSYLS